MRYSTFGAWLLPVMVLLVGLYFFRVQPMQEEVSALDQRAREMEDRAISLESAVREAARSVNPAEQGKAIVEALTTKNAEAPDYWSFLSEWREVKKDLTSLQFDRWVEEREDLQVLVKGTIGDVASAFSGNQCIVIIDRPKSLGWHWKTSASFLADCDRVGHLDEGDKIQVLCQLQTDRYHYSAPDVQDCQL